MPYKDPEKNRQAAAERKRRMRARNPGPGRGRHGKHVRGARHYRWNTGRMIGQDGYPKIRVGKDHALADGNGYAYEHLLVWVGSGRQRPSEIEVIHHLNGDKTDNRLANLMLTTRAEHNRIHMEERERDSFGRLKPIGKARAGRLLDGREWNEMPGVDK